MKIVKVLTAAAVVAVLVVAASTCASAEEAWCDNSVRLELPAP